MLSIDRFKSLALLFALLSITAVNAQQPLNIKSEPAVSITQKFNKRWEVNGSVAGLYTYGGFGEHPLPAGLNRLQISSFATYKLFNRQSLSIGYMYRKYAPLDENGYEHRLTEQYGFSWNISSYRIANRIRLEQRFRNAGITHRLRYRLSVDFPLNGQDIDPGEGYLILSEEPVFAIDNEGRSLENRFTAGGGWQITAEEKIEIGFEFRYRGREQPDAVHIGTTFYKIL